MAVLVTSYHAEPKMVASDSGYPAEANPHTANTFSTSWIFSWM